MRIDNRSTSSSSASPLEKAWCGLSLQEHRSIDILARMRRAGILACVSLRGSCIVRKVKRACRLITLLLVVLWPGVSSHALLESFGWIHEAPEDHHHHSEPEGSSESHHDDHNAADGRCLRSSTSVQVETPPLTQSAGLSLFVASAPAHHACRSLPPSGLAPPGVGPPTFISPWQFILRTALPARAPSTCP